MCTEFTELCTIYGPSYAREVNVCNQIQKKKLYSVNKTNRQFNEMS